MFSHQVDMSLAGSMDTILDQMHATSIALYAQFLDDYPDVTWEQWPGVRCMKAPRVPADSKIEFAELVNMSTKRLYDFCRMLEGPYPHAFLEDGEGILTIEKVSFKSKK